jgi:predicted signal transduction protein with EAL and GGDEF domain
VIISLNEEKPASRVFLEGFDLRTLVWAGGTSLEQLERLRALGCNRMQGFLFSPARPVGDWDGLLSGDRPWQDVSPVAVAHGS